MAVSGQFQIVETSLSEKDIPLALPKQHKRKVVRVVPDSSIILLSITELSFVYFYNKKDKQLYHPTIHFMWLCREQLHKTRSFYLGS
jgi:hypothetical protein